VLPWSTGSPILGGRNIPEEIEKAAGRCNGAIFLFTKVDPLAGEGKGAAPRDNVVFEAGCFTTAKDKERVLIIIACRSSW
jgi:predicted nucleotide-binding protein